MTPDKWDLHYETIFLGPAVDLTKKSQMSETFTRWDQFFSLLKVSFLTGVYYINMRVCLFVLTQVQDGND